MRNRWCILALSALAPVSVQLHATGDTVATVIASDGTRFEVLAGSGEYAFITRGCDRTIVSAVPGSFRDAAVHVEQGLGRSGLSLGVRGGWVHDDIANANGIGRNSQVYYGPLAAPPSRLQLDNRYINPYFTFEREAGSVGLGWVFHANEFITTDERARTRPDHAVNDLSGHLRIGRERNYFAVRWMEGVPIASSGGYLQLGVGGHPNGGPWNLYGGLGAGGPYEGMGIMMQAGYRFPNGMTASARTHLGAAASHDASGFSVGVGYGTFRP